MAHILIIGKSFSGLKRYLIDHEYTYTVLQDRQATKFPEKKFKHRIVADFSSKEALLQTVDMLKQRPDAIISTYENYVLPTAWISQHLGLPGMPIPAAEACTDKSTMRTLFAQAPEKISPEFATITNEDELTEFAKHHPFPFILKPANLSKSLLVTKSNTLEELLENYYKSLTLINDIYRKYAPNRSPKLLIEEYLEGSIHSVDVFVDASGMSHTLENIVDYQTGYDIGYDDNFHYSRLVPSILSPEDQTSLCHCAAMGVSALGMRSSPAHVEIIMTKDGPRIVEIGARNGGYRERMHWLANDIDITKNALALALNQPLDIRALKNDPVGVFELFPKTPGIFEGLTNEKELRQLPSLRYLSIKAKPGQLVGKAGDGYKMCAIVILHHSNQRQFEEDARYLREHVAIKVSQ